MTTTSRLGLYLPVGTLQATATGAGTTTTFVTTDTVTTPVTTQVRILHSDYSVLGNGTVLSVVEVAGTTTVTFTASVGGATASGDIMVIPETVDCDTWLNAQSVKIDTAIGAHGCTSSTRPATQLFTGKLIYETDTDKVYRYTSGAAWEEVFAAPISTSGYAGFADETLPTTTITTGNEYATPLASMTFSVSNNTRYRVQINHMLSTSVAVDNTPVLRLRYVSGSGPVAVTDTLALSIPLATYIANEQESITSVMHWSNVAISGTYTFGLFQYAGTRSVVLSNSYSIAFYMEALGSTA